MLKRGFKLIEYENRLERVQSMMYRNKIDILMITSEFPTIIPPDWVPLLFVIVLLLITTLLEPVKGKILFNGKEISYKKNTNSLISWRKNISYVPQFIALIDSTILENIALGTPANEVNLERAKDCAKTALIYDHIKTMKDGMYTNIGERGIKLSGGQIQRIGIARALYNGSEVLVLDEATSALDSETEEKLVKSIALKNKKITIIAISHRLSTLKNYERFIRVEKNAITEKTNLIN